MSKKYLMKGLWEQKRRGVERRGSAHMQVNDSLVLLLAHSSSLVFFGCHKPLLLFGLETERTRIVLSYINVKSFLNNILLYLPLTATFTTLLPFPRFAVGTTSYGLAVRISGFHSVDPGPLTVKEVIFSFAIYIQCIYRQLFLKISKELN